MFWQVQGLTMPGTLLQGEGGCNNRRYYVWKQTWVGGKQDHCWRRVATADVEDGGQFYECAICSHHTGGGHCIYLGDKEYEGMGKDQTWGIYSYIHKILRDRDGDLFNDGMKMKKSTSQLTSNKDVAAVGEVQVGARGEQACEHIVVVEV